MVKISELGSVLLLAQAEQHKRLSLGRLMTPHDVDDAFRGRQPDAHIPPGWVVCGEVHPAFFALVNRQEMQHLGRNYLRPGGTGYVVMAQQIGHWQHRFVLPLLGQEMRAYVAAMQDAEQHFSLANAGAEQAWLVRMPDFLRAVTPADLPVREVPADLPGQATEMCGFIASLLAPEALGDAALPAVRDVCVTIVQSAQLSGLLELDLMRQRGQASH